MGDDKKAKSKTDSIFSQIEKWITKALGSFVAALFLIFGAGALFGASVIGTQHAWLLFAPFALALLAYYNRDFAVAGFVLFLLLFLI